MALTQEYKTLAGLTLEEAVKKMMEVLPPGAYKAVPGNLDLTDIDPAWLTKVSTDVFGIAGIGWWFSYAPEHLEVYSEVRTNSRNQEYTTFIANLQRLDLAIAYDVNGERVESRSIVSNGYSENQNKGYAIRGALSNAIGSAFAKLCWQLPVYMGMVDHKNAAELYDKKKKRNEQQGTTQPEKETKTEKAPAKENTDKPTPEPEKKAEKQPQPEPEKAQTFTEADPEVVRLWAQNVIIPSDQGIPMEGLPFKDVIKDAILGEAVLRFVAGEQPNKKGDFFKVTGDHEKDAQRAAKALLEALPAKGNGKGKK